MFTAYFPITACCIFPTDLIYCPFYQAFFHELLKIFTVYLKCSDSSSAAVLEHYTDLIQNLASGEKISILTDSQPPEGCAISTVSARCEVHMMLKVNVAIIDDTCGPQGRPQVYIRGTLIRWFYTEAPLCTTLHNTCTFVRKYL